MFGSWERKEYSNGGVRNGRGEYGEFESVDDGEDLGDDIGKDELGCVSEDGCSKRCNWITKSSGKLIRDHMHFLVQNGNVYTRYI